MTDLWADYESPGCFDELMNENGRPRAHCRRVVNQLQRLSAEEAEARRAAAELSIREMGVSFTVYSQAGNIDRAWPFDLIPRVITAKHWQRVRKGLIQRSRALNCFIQDVYNKQRILADGIVPAELVLDSPNFKEPCRGVSPPRQTWGPHLWCRPRARSRR